MNELLKVVGDTLTIVGAVILLLIMILIVRGE